MLLLELVSRLVVGRRILPSEREALRGQVRLLGFRKTARGYLWRAVGDGAQARDGLVVIAPALGGLFPIAVDVADLLLGQEILTTGSWEPHIVAFYARYLRAGMTVVDVGANIGFHALHAACRVGQQGRVLAFEPDPRNASLLRMSLGLQEHRPSVEVIEAALSDRDGELVLSDLGNPGNAGARFTHQDRGHLERLVHGPHPTFRTVAAWRFDSRFDPERIDLVKIDVEGFEPRAMAGMAESIARCRPVILTEFAPSNLREIGGVDPVEYLSWFLDRGYSCSILGCQGVTSGRERFGSIPGPHVSLSMLHPRPHGRRGA